MPVLALQFGINLFTAFELIILHRDTHFCYDHIAVLEKHPSVFMNSILFLTDLFNHAVFLL